MKIIGNGVDIVDNLRIKKAIKNENFITSLRQSSKIELLNTSPHSSKCVISGASLTPETGKTLLMHLLTHRINMCCMHQRFVEDVNKYYNIAHFDDEIYKTFKEWYSQKYRNVENIDPDKLESVSNDFISYNSGSKINLLYIKFNTNCDL